MVDYSPNIIASFCITFPIATLVVILRLISKRMTTTGYGLEDILAVCSWVGSKFTVLLRCYIGLADYGLGRPIEQGLSSQLTLDEKTKVSWLILWCSSILYSFTIAFCKFSILCFYWRLFKYSSVRIPVQVLSGLTLAWFILRLFLVTLQCIPIQGLWDHSVKHSCGVNETVFFFTTVLTHVLIDCAILALPIIEVGKMHLPKGQKIAVITLFLFGALVCLASVFVLVESLKFDSRSKEITLEMGVHSSAAVAEVNLAVISTSLPLLRPICRRMVPGFSFSSKNYHQSEQSPREVVLEDWATKPSAVARTSHHDIQPLGLLTDEIQGEPSHLSAEGSRG
ncbi:uncharacterized protein NECHADRAFT_45204 [Fusarium vanettenii 77-13-4]|uniref:Rhodopsin domain-containing protein n=1 Tax=Fusarium vanettenii (strain ATCC MYA-4622 / CBS 123669 / FGSC 9596 / NRRL 45880 / 77-13-4) TaxID=660122 RepID=C7YY07_FUSV7|nr:uncharacterized protein NECHADRAFT_45204 [Fusarium vanettenii 77-13-4]EEU43685.1 hypothetical protein NECHADRAFT_45204 [Fusarium vanettenii 77-13-4]